MNKRTITLGCGLAMLLVSPAAAEDDSQRIQQQNQQNLQQQENDRQSQMFTEDQDYRRGAMSGDQEPTQDTKQEIAGTLTDVLQAAVSGDLEAMIDTFEESDRERLGREEDSDVGALKQHSDRIEQQWEEKFGREFDDNLDKAMIPFRVEPVGQERVKVTIPSAGGAEEATVTFVDEGEIKTTWRIDVPDSLTAAQLREKLTTQLQQFSQNSQSWGSEEGKVYHQFAARVLSTIGDAQSASDSMPSTLKNQTGTERQQMEEPQIPTQDEQRQL